ncbi:hypothetical protein [Arthrobacter sp. 2MCAF14]|uniref:hypothetical protein n=1 Tax=Arthrobacter sp. 2MCAF14 TaxID=3232982 RepID=UPI003F8F0BC8
MPTYDWRALARDEDPNRVYVHGQFSLPPQTPNLMKCAMDVAVVDAIREGCDPDTLADLKMDISDCEHGDFDKWMDGSRKCLDCGKGIKGLAG